MFKNYRDDEHCPVCNKNMNDVAEGRINCLPCGDSGERRSAQRSVLHHFWLSLVCLFNFEFWGVIAETTWAIERLTGTGDYNKKTGWYYTKGYLK